MSKEIAHGAWKFWKYFFRRSPFSYKQKKWKAGKTLSCGLYLGIFEKIFSCCIDLDVCGASLEISFGIRGVYAIRELYVDACVAHISIYTRKYSKWNFATCALSWGNC